MIERVIQNPQEESSLRSEGVLPGLVANEGSAGQPEQNTASHPETAIALDGLAVAAKQRPDGFDVLQEPDALAVTQEIFQTGRLLARAVDRPLLTRHGLDFGPLDSEISLLRAEEGLEHVSSTLLVPGENIPVYKPVGFLVDSDKAAIEHIANQDSGSATNGEGQLVASETVIPTLTALAEQVRNTHSTHLNEVNITLSGEALRGLFATSYPRPMLAALAIQRHLSEGGQGALPLFVYDQTRGAIGPWEPQTEEVAELFAALSPAEQAAYSNVLTSERQPT